MFLFFERLILTLMLFCLSETTLNTAARLSLNNLGHWPGLQTLAKDQCFSAMELPVREFLVSAAHKRSSAFCCLCSPIIEDQYSKHSVLPIPSLDCRYFTF